VKVQVKGEDSYGLSAIAPEIYRDRYCCSLCHVSSVSYSIIRITGLSTIFGTFWMWTTSDLPEATQITAYEMYIEPVYYVFCLHPTTRSSTTCFCVLLLLYFC
jgi:hypothetical protein